MVQILVDFLCDVASVLMPEIVKSLSNFSNGGSIQIYIPRVYINIYYIPRKFDKASFFGETCNEDKTLFLFNII